LDLEKDTLASIGSLLVNVSGLSELSNTSIHIDAVTLDKGVVKLRRDRDGIYNYAFIQDYFSTDKKTTKKQSPVLRVDNVYLSDLRFHYDDNRKDRMTRGMDYAHLALDGIDLELENVRFKKDMVSAEINQLAARERCGFQL